MAKISIDVDEIKKNLKAKAWTAAGHLTDMARRAQKDFSQGEVLKKIDKMVEVVKSQEFMKHPRVAELTKRIVAISEQVEKTVTKNASHLVDQVKAKVIKKAHKEKTTRRTHSKKSGSSEN